MAKENETIADIRKEAEAKFRELVEAWMQRRSTFQTTLGAMQAFNNVFDHIDAAHKREIDALDQRRTELDAEVAAKDAVIKRLDDAISEEQRRKMATTEKSSAVGDCAKLREAVGYILKYADSVACRDYDEHTRHYIDQIRKWAQSALAAPPRNCDIAQDWLHDLYVNFKPPASVKREMPPEWVDAVMAFCRWLFAPATEKEGGAK